MSSSASRPVRPDGFSKEKKKCLLASKKNGVFTHLVGDTAKFKLSKPCALDVQIEVNADDTSRGGLILRIAFPLREDSPYRVYNMASLAVTAHTVSVRFPPGSFDLGQFATVTEADFENEASKEVVRQGGFVKNRIRLRLQGDKKTVLIEPQLIGFPWPYDGPKELAKIFNCQASLGLLDEWTLKELNRRPGLFFIMRGNAEAQNKLWHGKIEVLNKRVFSLPVCPVDSFDPSDWENGAGRQWKALISMAAPFQYQERGHRAVTWDSWQDYANATRLGPLLDWFTRHRECRELGLEALRNWRAVTSPKNQRLMAVHVPAPIKEKYSAVLNQHIAPSSKSQVKLVRHPSQAGSSKAKDQEDSIWLEHLPMGQLTEWIWFLVLDGGDPKAFETDIRFPKVQTPEQATATNWQHRFQRHLVVQESTAAIRAVLSSLALVEQGFKFGVTTTIPAPSIDKAKETLDFATDTWKMDADRDADAGADAAVQAVVDKAALKDPMELRRLQAIVPTVLKDFLAGSGLSRLAELGDKERAYLVERGYDLGGGNIVPTVNFMHGIEETAKELIETVAEPRIRKDLEAALKAVPMGWLLVIGFAGSGKTQLLALIARIVLANPRLNKLAVLGPTHTAIDNMADRIFDLTIPGRKPMVVRAYTTRQMSELMDDFVQRWGLPKPGWQPQDWTASAPFRVRFTAPWWIAKILRFDGQALGANDPGAAFTIRKKAEEDTTMLPLVADYLGGRFEGEKRSMRRQLQKLVDIVMEEADVLCFHPTATEDGTARPMLKFLERSAKCAMVDEAGAISQGLGLRAFANGLPCIFGGDDKQLPPYVATIRDKVVGANGQPTPNYVNPWAMNAKVSLLEKIRCSAWQSFELNTQHRIVQGGFDLARALVYKSVKNFTYGDSAKVTNHPPAAKLENWVSRNATLLGRPRPLGIQGFQSHLDTGNIYPVFVHVPNARSRQVGTGKDNEGHGMVTVQLVHAIEKEFHDEVAKGMTVGVLSPYKAQVAALSNHLQGTKAFVSTIDGIQGREADVIIFNFVVTGNDSSSFVADLKRLNFSLTRHRYFLFVVGDWAMKVERPVAGARPKDERQEDGTLRAAGVEVDGLRAMKDWFRQSGRVFAASPGQGWVSLSSPADPEAKGSMVAQYLRKPLVASKSSEDTDVGTGTSMDDEGKEIIMGKETEVVASAEDDQL